MSETDNKDSASNDSAIKPQPGKLPEAVDGGSENDAVAKEPLLSREQLLSAREDSAHLREMAADLREDAVQLREETVTLREHANPLFSAALHGQDSSPTESIQEATSILRQANEHLVIATLEAQKQAEQIQQAKDQLDYLAHHDALTDLPNRILLQDRLNQAIELARRQSKNFAVMFMDLDRFKHINDSLGHAVGDQLLLSVAHRLKGCVRHSDTISRHGGDEFVLLLSSIEHAEDAALSAQKMLAALALPHRIDRHDIHISVSIGISIYPNDGRDAETLIKSADTAMYYAKESGRNNYKFFESNMNALAVRRQNTEAGLRRALERQEFILHYQPEIDLHSGRIIGVEALIRWRHPELGLLAPEQFVPIAQECGLILPIGRWMLREACFQARLWQQAQLPAIPVSINISGVEFRDKCFLKNIRSALKEAGLEPRYLELELTENVLMQDTDLTNSVLHALAELGVKLAVDNFGTGCSSLSYLRTFSIDTLKIDRSFVNRMIGNQDDAAIVSTVINMGKSLNKRIIAEGVETPEQAAFLMARQCDEGQGYYFGYPVAAEAFTHSLQTGV